MRPRMYGSRLRKWWRTSTWPSPGVPTGFSSSRKLSAVASPLGRETRWICRLICAMVRSPLQSVGSVRPLDALAARGQSLEVLERSRRMRDELAVAVDERGFAEPHRRRPVQPPPRRDEAAEAGSHERRLHLD